MVCTKLSQTNNSKGLIDEDPGSAQHPYQREGAQNQDFIQYDIRRVYYPSQGNNLIILCPKLEDWFLKTAHTCKIDVTRHGFPDDPNKLHRMIDQKLTEFRILINMLKRVKSDRIQTLTELLKT